MSTPTAPKRKINDFENFINKKSMGILSGNTKGQITAVNNFLPYLLSYNSTEDFMKVNMLNSPFFVNSGISAAIKEALATGNNTYIKARYTSKIDKQLFLNFNIFPLKDENGSVNSFQILVEDITDNEDKVSFTLSESDDYSFEKNNVISTTDDDLENVELFDIIDCEYLQAMMEDFNKLTGHLLSIGDLHGNPLVAVGWQDICTKYHRVHPKTCEYCTESDLEICRNLEPDKYKLYKCKNNLWEGITPIFVEGVHLGNIYYGQCFFDDEELPYETFRAQAKKHGFDEEEYMEAFDKVPVVSRDKVHTIMSFYTRLTQLLSSLGYNNIKLSKALNEREILLTSLTESENRFRSYLEQAPDAIFLTDDKGDFLDVNEAAIRITGYSKEEIKRMNFFDISAEKDTSKSDYTSLIENGNLYVDWDILTKNGDKRILAVKAVKLSDETFLGFARDITKRKMAENALVLSENNFSSLFELTTVGVAQVGPDGFFMRVNEHFLEMVGYSIDEISAMNFRDITHPDDLSLDEQYVMECIEGKIDSYEIEKRFIHKEGQTIWVKLSVKVVRDVNNVGVYVIAVITDITGERKAEIALEENEAFLNEVETIAKIGGWELDAASGKMIWDPIIAKIYEFNDDEPACIEEFLPFHTDDSKQILEKSINETIENNEPFDIEVKLITTGKMNKWTRIIGRAVSEGGSIVKLVGAIQDITVNKIATQEIEQNEKKYRTLFEQSNDAIILHDMEGNIIDMNTKACVLFGYSYDELKNKNITGLIAPEDQEMGGADLMKVIATGSVRNVTKMIRSDGKTVFVDVSSTLLQGQDNLILAVGRDITDRIKAEKVLLNAKIEAETANRTKSEFLANMSHELRTPLNSVIGFSEMMLNSINEGTITKQERYLQNISNSGQHLLDLINNILDISKVEAGKMELNCGNLNLTESIYDIVTMVESLASKKNITIDVDAADDLPIISADRAKIKQIMYNLIGNAIKFTDEKGMIIIRARELDNKIRISIIDDGIGISLDDQKKLFKPFSQIDSSTSRKYTGTGLGLALVKELVELHEGNIWLESEAGKGSTFTFEIPIKEPFL